MFSKRGFTSVRTANQPIRIQQDQSRMSIQKQSMTPQKDLNGNVNRVSLTLKQPSVKVIVHNAKDPFPEPESESQSFDGINPPNSRLWSYVIPPQMKAARKRVLVFKQIEYIISNWSGDKFPNVLYLNVDGMSGYFDATGTVTTPRVAALSLAEINPILDQAEIRTYDLKYCLKQSVNWQFPGAWNTLVIRMQADEQAMTMILPLPNPILLHFEIRTQ